MTREGILRRRLKRVTMGLRMGGPRKPHGPSLYLCYSKPVRGHFVLGGRSCQDFAQVTSWCSYTG
jgi:hypothetical protein